MRRSDTLAQQLHGLPPLRPLLDDLLTEIANLLAELPEQGAQLQDVGAARLGRGRERPVVSLRRVVQAHVKQTGLVARVANFPALRALAEFCIMHLLAMLPPRVPLRCGKFILQPLQREATPTVARQAFLLGLSSRGLLGRHTIATATSAGPAQLELEPGLAAATASALLPEVVGDVMREPEKLLAQGGLQLQHTILHALLEVLDGICTLFSLQGNFIGKPQGLLSRCRLHIRRLHPRTLAQEFQLQNIGGNGISKAERLRKALG